MLSFLISVLAVIGLVNAFFIYAWKKQQRSFVCVVGNNCDKVIYSSYGSLMGVENTLFGIGYYVFLLLFPYLSLDVGLLRFVVSVAALASLYLLYIQFKVLRKWCDYCLLGALINFILLYLVL
jgi:uncharacterized membrane protein